MAVITPRRLRVEDHQASAFDVNDYATPAVQPVSQVLDRNWLMVTMPVPDFRGTEPCTDVPLEAFFEARDGASHQWETKVVISVCQSCPIQVECQEWAIAHQEYGVFGGLTQSQRRHIRKLRGWAINTPYLHVMRGA